MSLALASLLASTLAADAIPPDKAAAIERDQEKAQATVNAKYGDRKQSDLSPDERRAMMKESAEAEEKVFEKHGITAKDWAVNGVARSRGDQSQVAATKKDLADKEKAAKEAEKAQKAAAEKPKTPGEIPVQRGFSDSNPVVVEEAKGGVPVVEKGLPAEAIADQEAASGGSGKDMGKKGAEKDDGKQSPKKHAAGKHK
jgi:hypothetical protein